MGPIGKIFPETKFDFFLLFSVVGILGWAVIELILWLLSFFTITFTG